MLSLLFACIGVTGDTSAAAAAESFLKSGDLDKAAEVCKASADPSIYACATVAAFHGDFDHASALIASQIPAKRADQEFWAHNQLTWLRWASGDFAGALVETDQQRALALRVKDKKTQVALLLHALWDRAYLLRELASRQPKDSSGPTLRYAQAARAEYEKVGPKDGGRPILTAWFALLDGNGAAARAAVEKLDLKERDDVQDLYVIWRALKAGGNDAAAQKVEQMVKSSNNYYLGLALYRRLFKE